MANWCSNFVGVSGDKENVANFMAEIISLKKESEEKQEGVRPCEDGIYMFDIYIIDESWFSFETKWSPALDSLKFLGQKHSVNLSCEYSELGCLIYGKWEYDFESDSESETYLESEDFDLFSYNDETSTYTFEGEEYETEEDILETLLGRKF